MGEPAAAMLEGLRTKPLYIEVDLGALDSSGHAGHRFEGLPRFPAMVRDLALKVRESVSFGAIATAVRTGASDQLEDLSLVEIFRGPQVGVGMKSLNIRLTFRSKTSTLTSAGIDAEMKQIVDALSSATAAEVRGA
jgi:phenylalanyl-tRNA synthetase beta chain